MPPTKQKKRGLTDTWGRRNRKLTDCVCSECGSVFRPRAARSKYCSRPCQWKNNSSGHWKDGPIWWKTHQGYIEGKVWQDGKRRRVSQHRYVMEQELDHALEPGQCVHHINGDKADNRIENLRLMSRTDHKRHHGKEGHHNRGRKLNLSEEERERRAERNA